ncbi:phage tail protein [Rhodococcus rhodochrous]|uniref:phage tail protein n=1 Tax=Rhodococcus rhodochrous TaxID=1829 RepID=UPI001E290E2A|nr:phage tail protein [Rhodococcus rhodochrous]MCD2099530.1 phage tail protein [Rhodococcus rhodochrous]MCD2123898.1 phage tail protein [Rhodococcus rhodochrous]MCQ4136675.1 phage tail protein [Rhodococcus rhodochrous]
MKTIVELEGVNGEWFTLAGQGAGAEGVWLGTEVEGIYDAPVKTIWTEHAHQIGASYAGMRNLRRDITFTAVIVDTPGQPWEESDSAWRKAWSYSQPCKLWIETESSRRYLKVQLAEQPLFKPEKDPHQRKIEKVFMTLVAGDPWWYEEDETDSWTLETGTSGSGTVTVSNPTDQEIWLKWVLQGPARWRLPDFSWKDDQWANRQISMPLQVPDQTFRVDTDPFEDQLRDENGSQVWSLMNGITYLHPVPPYTEETEIPVSVTEATPGVGVQVRCPRTWSRPWGMQ